MFAPGCYEEQLDRQSFDLEVSHGSRPGVGLAVHALWWVLILAAALAVAGAFAGFGRRRIWHSVCPAPPRL